MKKIFFKIQNEKKRQIEEEAITFLFQSIDGRSDSQRPPEIKSLQELLNSSDDATNEAAAAAALKHGKEFFDAIISTKMGEVDCSLFSIWPTFAPVRHTFPGICPSIRWLLAQHCQLCLSDLCKEKKEEERQR